MTWLNVSAQKQVYYIDAELTQSTRMLWGFCAWSADSNPLLPDWHKLLAGPFPKDKLWLSLPTAVTSHVPIRRASFTTMASRTPKDSIFGSYNPPIPGVGLFKTSVKISSASPNMQNPFQNARWRKKGKAKIKVELQSTRENYFSNVFKYSYFYVQWYSCILSCSLGLPLLTLRSNWHFCQQFIKSLLSATPLPPHLQASRDLGLTRLLWRGCYWLSVLAASPSFLPALFWNTI